MATLINKIIRRIFGSSKKRSDEELVHVDNADLAQDVRVRSAPTTKPSADPLEVPVFEDRGDSSRPLRTTDSVDPRERQDEKERKNILHPDDSWFRNEETIATDYSDRSETADEISLFGDHVGQSSPAAVEEGRVRSSALAPTNESSPDRGEASWAKVEIPPSVETPSGEPPLGVPTQPSAWATPVKLPSTDADPASDPDTTRGRTVPAGPAKREEEAAPAGPVDDLDVYPPESIERSPEDHRLVSTWPSSETSDNDDPVESVVDESARRSSLVHIDDPAADLQLGPDDPQIAEFETDNGIQHSVGASPSEIEHAVAWSSSEWWQDALPSVDAELTAEHVSPWGDRDPADPDVDDESDDRQIRRVAARAARLTDVLAPVRDDTRSRMLRSLRDLLAEFPHGASHAAIERLVRGGTSWAELQEIAELVRFWRADPMLWRRRRFDPMRREWIVFTDRRGGRLAFGWEAAARVVSAVEREQAEAWIAGDWLAAWHRLHPRSPGFMSYAQFIDLEVAALREGVGGVVLDPPAEELGEDWEWLARLDPELAAMIRRDGRPPLPSSSSLDGAGFSGSSLALDRW
jgi:hypothetical protein